MAFEATFDLPINGATHTLKRIRDDAYSSEYLKRTSTYEYRMFVRHSTVKSRKVDPLLRGVERHNIEVIQTIYATSSTPEIIRRTYAVHEFSPGDDLAAGLQFYSDVHAKISATEGVIDDLLNMLS